MIDSFTFQIDWIIVSVVIGLLVALIGAFCIHDATTIKLLVRISVVPCLRLISRHRSAVRPWRCSRHLFLS